MPEQYEPVDPAEQGRQSPVEQPGQPRIGQAVPIAPAPSYRPDEEQIVADRLAALGYLD